MSDPNDAIQSLSRIVQASARLIAHMHYVDALVDLHAEIDHIQANLNHVRELVQNARR